MRKMWNRNRMSILPLTAHSLLSPWTLAMTVKWHFYWRNSENVYLQLGRVLYSARVPAINHTVAHRRRHWAMTATLAVAAPVALSRSTSLHRIFTNWKLISTTARFTYDVANVLLPYQRQTKALLWIMAMRWHAREKWVPQSFKYLNISVS